MALVVMNISKKASRFCCAQMYTKGTCVEISLSVIKVCTGNQTLEFIPLDPYLKQYSLISNSLSENVQAFNIHYCIDTLCFNQLFR